MNLKFTKEMAEKFRNYVYLYSDPDTNEVFYVGKGKGNRVFRNLTDSVNEKTRANIEQIRSRGKEPICEILTYGFQDEKDALKVEAAAIDLIGKDNLTNKSRGYKSVAYGRVEVKQLIALYNPERVEILEPSILIRINKLFRYGMSEIELYDVARGVWKIGQDRNRVKYAFAVYDGIIQEVYTVLDWFKAGTTLSTRGLLSYRTGRWEFVGQKAPDNIRERYIDKSVRHYFKKHHQNPIVYVNIKKNKK